MKQLILFLAFFTQTSFAYCQPKFFRVMSYNAENLFDADSDSLGCDKEFVPGGVRGWNYSRYRHKLLHLEQVIVNVGGWEAPTLVALCEVENKHCLYDLTALPALKKLHYRYLHHDSPDPRGIDVALLYRPDQFKVIAERAIGVYNPRFPKSYTRDILYACGITHSGDTLHVFVCHFPSRMGGELESEEKRIFAASILRAQTDSLQSRNPRSNILIMGDFNDYPDNTSLSETLGAKAPGTNVCAGGLYNLLFNWQSKGKGTHKLQGEWGVLDQIIVSGAMLDGKGTLCTSVADAAIFQADFLLEEDTGFLGKRPFRTYIGFKYHDGYSDHLPVYADIKYSIN